jgi:Fe-S cluster assembly ATP-binding protein
MLSIKDLSVNVWEKEILKNISFDFEEGKNYCILWKNGSWKSSLAMSIAWNPRYEIVSWNITLDWTPLKNLKPDERSKLGIFLSFQNIPEIPGVKLFEFLKSIYDLRQNTPSSFLWFKKIIEPLMNEIEVDKSFLWRDLNVWFSWWEKRKIEVLQIKLLNPKIIILDEIDSGLDVNAVKQVSNLIKAINTDKNTFLIITHLFEMLEWFPIEKAIVLKKWEIDKIWWKDLIEKIKKEGF